MSTQRKSIQKEPTSPSGLYIHIPFCRSKCPYCDFYSIASTSLVPQWLEALEKEILFYKDKFYSFDTIYFGGGTPSLLDIDMIEKILNTLKTEYSFKEDTEITLEANPCDMTPVKIEGIKSLGTNRINLGVQSFNDDELHFLGRRHRGSDSERVLNDLGKAGFDNIGIDLIYGLKSQTLKAWQKTLEQAIDFSPEHISCYQLTIEGKTVFNAMKNKGILDNLAEDEAGSFFLKTAGFLEENGYLHYEVSNYARGLKYKSRHNIKYWDRIPYLGLGPSAHSFDGRKRWWNHRSARKYCASLRDGESPIENFEILTGEQEILEKLALGLRTAAGLDMDILSIYPESIKKIKELETSGHIRINGSKIVPTKKGLLVADQLPLYIIPSQYNS
ncbi:radical SAM family heme chaperone HemW [Thermodesulfobacteriota bacterium]